MPRRVASTATTFVASADRRDAPSFQAGLLSAAGRAGTEPRQRFPWHVPGEPERAREQSESDGAPRWQSPGDRRSSHPLTHLRDCEADDAEDNCDGQECIVIEGLQGMSRDRRVQGPRCATSRTIETGHRPERTAGIERRGVRIDEADVGASGGGETGKAPVDRPRRKAGPGGCHQWSRRRRSSAWRRWNCVRSIHGESLRG